jgi:HEAT repeat protein
MTDSPPLDHAPIADQGRRPCEAAFEFLADNHPSELLGLIVSNRLGPTDLTFAAEIAGKLSDSEAVRRTLLPLLMHDDAVVREGAVYGLALHADETVRAALIRHSASDPSPAVRQAATDALADL